MKQRLSLILILCAGFVAGPSVALAEENAKAAPKKTAKPAAKKPSKKKETAKAPPVTDDEEGEPDIANLTATDYDCELGNKLTIYAIKDDDQHIALRWKKRLMRLTRVDTTTGAHRFENPKIGLVWLGIPAKGILLDSKKGQQLANECKNAEQRAPVVPAGSEISLIQPATTII